jgi:hypothetical protein
MPPKFTTPQAWEQADLLMQPTFIRVIDNIRKELDASVWQGSYEELDAPYPSYRLCLTDKTRTVTVDIWELCFQVCFTNYLPSASESQEVEVDQSLFDEEGALDWNRLESKTQQIVRRVFANLPSNSP